MSLYLVQHGEAKPKSEDPQRPLTDEGAEHARRMAAQAAQLGVQVSAIWSSDKRRAVETADLFASALDAPHSVREGLAPDDDVSPLVEELREIDANVLIVGHLPHLSRLASALATGDSTRELVLFQNAGIVRLDREDGEFRIRWVLPPEVTEHR